MKKCINGVVYEMSVEEIADMENRPLEDLPQSSEERIAELEAALELLLSGVTE